MTKRFQVFAKSRQQAGHSPRTALKALILISAAGLAGCSASSGLFGSGGLDSISETTQHGYVVSPMALEQVPVGASREQVLIALGSPSTTGEFEGEVFYYISQTKKRGAQFMTAKVIDQRVLAIYFDKKSNVERIADYGLQDGRIFDFRTETTPTSGRDLSFIGQILRARPGNLFGGSS